jgi:hypothetical protein
MKTYITLNDGKIGYVNICTCEECKKRNMPELLIYDLNDNYLDCIKANMSGCIIYMGESLSKAISSISEYFLSQIEKQEKEKSYLQNIINYYCDQLLKTNNA